jgi:hypothetical protein
MLGEEDDDELKQFKEELIARGVDPDDYIQQMKE